MVTGSLANTTNCYKCFILPISNVTSENRFLIKSEIVLTYMFVREREDLKVVIFTCRNFMMVYGIKLAEKLW